MIHPFWIPPPPSLKKPQQKAIKTGSFLMTDCERIKPVLFTVNSSGNKSHKPKKKNQEIRLGGIWNYQAEPRLAVSSLCYELGVIWSRHGDIWTDSHQQCWSENIDSSWWLDFYPHLRKQTGVDAGAWHHSPCLFCPLFISNLIMFSKMV